MKTNTPEADSRRLREIMGVLRRRRIVKDLSPANVRAALEELGSTFVKLGQILSMRPDIIPSEYCDEFQKLRTDVAQLPFDVVKQVVEEELSHPLEDIFSSFEEKCIGSASIAQAHKAVLKTGESVVVKVQRPGIRKTMQEDIGLLKKAAKLLNLTKISRIVDLDMAIREFWNTTKDEMNFLLEADNLEEFASNHSEIKYVSCPKVYRRYCTEKVLVMEYINAVRIDDDEMLRQGGYDLEEIGMKLAVSYVRQVTEHRFFHADPHPGNIWIREGQIFYLDMGMMGRVSSFESECYKKAIDAVSERDFETLKDTIITICPPSESIDEDAFAEDIERFLDRYTQLALADMDIGSIVADILKIATSYHLKIPANMVMLGRGFVTLEGVLAMISPGVNILSVVAEMAVGNKLKNIDIKKEALSIGKDIVGSGRELARLPGQLSRTLDSLNSGKTKVKMTLANSEQTKSFFDTVSKRVVTGVISASFILGSAIFSCSQSAPRAMMWIFLALGAASAGYSFFKK